MKYRYVMCVMWPIEWFQYKRLVHITCLSCNLWKYFSTKDLCTSHVSCDLHVYKTFDAHHMYVMWPNFYKVTLWSNFCGCIFFVWKSIQILFSRKHNNYSSYNIICNYILNINFFNCKEFAKWNSRANVICYVFVIHVMYMYVHVHVHVYVHVIYVHVHVYACTCTCSFYV